MRRDDSEAEIMQRFMRKTRNVKKPGSVRWTGKEDAHLFKILDIAQGE